MSITGKKDGLLGAIIIAGTDCEKTNLQASTTAPISGILGSKLL